jgi:hypothetical protein
MIAVKEWVEEEVGPWLLNVRISFWDESGDGKVIVADTRDPMVRHEVDAYRFPAGWRCSAIDTLPVPARVRAAARRAMSRLP